MKARIDARNASGAVRAVLNRKIETFQQSSQVNILRNLDTKYIMDYAKYLVDTLKPIDNVASQITEFLRGVDFAENGNWDDFQVTFSVSRASANTLTIIS
jgi:hypothetical protein